MSRSRKFITHLGLALMLFLSVGVASAAPAADHSVVTGPVSFTIPAGQCPALPAGMSVSGEGTSVAIINTRARADGGTEIRVSNLIKGTATDSHGGTHTFVYQNTSTDIISPSGNSVHMKDSFTLSGPGPSYSVGFNWRWTYTTANWPPEANWEQTSTHGDPFACDPL